MSIYMFPSTFSHSAQIALMMLSVLFFLLSIRVDRGIVPFFFYLSIGLAFGYLSFTISVDFRLLSLLVLVFTSYIYIDKDKLCIKGSDLFVDFLFYSCFVFSILKALSSFNFFNLIILAFLGCSLLIIKILDLNLNNDRSAGWCYFCGLFFVALLLAFFINVFFENSFEDVYSSLLILSVLIILSFYYLDLFRFSASSCALSTNENANRIAVISVDFPFKKKLDVDEASISFYRTIMEKINEIVCDQELYLKKGLKLQDLADITGLTVRDISRAVNIIEEESFNDYVNRLRVRHLIEELDSIISNEKNKPLIIYELANQSGFGSKTTFNVAFKKYSGQTPTQYIKERRS